MTPASRLAATSHWRVPAPVTSRRVRRSQSRGASRNTSPKWASTCMVIAPNHSTKLALCTFSSSGSQGRLDQQQPNTAEQQHQSEDHHDRAEQAQQHRWRPLAPVGGGAG